MRIASVLLTVLMCIAAGRFGQAQQLGPPSQQEHLRRPYREYEVRKLVGLLRVADLGWERRKLVGTELGARSHAEAIPAVYWLLSSLRHPEPPYGTDPYDRGATLEPQEQTRAICWRIWREHLGDYAATAEIGPILLELWKRDKVRTELPLLLLGLKDHWLPEAAPAVTGVLHNSDGKADSHLRLLAAETLAAGMGAPSHAVIMEVARRHPVPLRVAPAIGAARQGNPYPEPLRQLYVEAMIAPRGARASIPAPEPKLTEFCFGTLQLLVQAEGVAAPGANSLATLMERCLGVSFAPDEKQRLAKLPEHEANDLYYRKSAEYALAWWKANAPQIRP